MPGCEPEGVCAVVTVRDVANVFRRLLRLGWSQRRVAELAVLTHSEALAILGGRQAVGFNALVQVGYRLEIPRGWLGLTLADDAPVGEL